jgi:protein-L-isoaspartate(D-aspartate) O-methyltransferase
MNFDIARKRMVESQLVNPALRDRQPITDRRVIEAMLKIPRHLFVQEAMASQAYNDTSLPIGEKQTISQPYMVALMSELLELKGTEKVLEIGTGSGYQAAILASLADRVYTIERIRPLANRARAVLDRLCLVGINIKIDDGSTGWQEEAPFDAIMVTAGAPDVPHDLLNQLGPGGRLVIPVGGESGQTLLRITRTPDDGFKTEKSIPCRFVKLVGKQGWTAED